MSAATTPRPASGTSETGAAPGHLDRYAVIGNPVEHSKSPFIHAAFAAQTGQAVHYEARLAPRDAFATSVADFVAAGGRGMNVTVPFKLEAFAFANTLSARAQAAGAVNTLRVEADGSLYGDNTDGVGLVTDIQSNLAVPLRGRRVLLLGAGGAARGVLLPLLEQAPATLWVINRTASKAQELVRRFEALGQRSGCVLAALPEDAPLHGCDVIINATAGSLDDRVPAFDSAALTPGCLAYDMMYAAAPTVFMRHASACGARVADGLGMLVEQAAESFHVWRGVRPEAAPVLAALRATLSQPQPN